MNYWSILTVAREICFEGEIAVVKPKQANVMFPELLNLQEKILLTGVENFYVSIQWNIENL